MCSDRAPPPPPESSVIEPDVRISPSPLPKLQFDFALLSALTLFTPHHRTSATMTPPIPARKFLPATLPTAGSNGSR